MKFHTWGWLGLLSLEAGISSSKHISVVVGRLCMSVCIDFYESLDNKATASPIENISEDNISLLKSYLRNDTVSIVEVF